MAIVKTILKKTHQEAVVKVAGTAAAGTISLASDILAVGQALDGSTQSANIVGVTWTGAADGIITITRNSVVVMTLQANAAGALEFGGQSMLPDSIENTSDVVVTISGAQAECWLRLRKVGGYKTTIEPEQFGIYDNPAVAGS
jgi:hypothetical protein